MKHGPVPASSSWKTRRVSGFLAALLAAGVGGGADRVEKTAASGSVRLRVGEKLGSVLESTDPMLPGKGRYREFRLIPPRSGKIAIRMLSKPFDAYLIVRGPDGETLAEDDNGGPGDGAQLVVEVEARREYRVLAASSQEGGMGAFSLEARRGTPRERSRREDLERDRAWFEKAIESDVSVIRRADLLAALGSCLGEIDALPEALSAWMRALESYRNTGNRQGEARMLGNIGAAHIHLGHPYESLRYSQEALAIFEALQDKDGEAWALGNLGVALMQLDEPQRSVDCHQRALELRRAAKDRKGEAGALQNLGASYSELGETEKAMKCSREALEVYLELGERRGEGDVIGDLGAAYAEQGDHEKAVEQYLKAIEIYRETENRRSLGVDLGNLGVAYNALGQPEKAIPHLEEALRIRRELQDVRGQGIVHEMLGNSYAQLRRTKEAVEHYEQALKLHRQAHHRRGEADVLLNLGMAYARLGRTKEATEQYELALEIHGKDGHLPDEAGVLRELAGFYEELADYEKAMECLERARELVQKTGDHREYRIVLANLGFVCAELGEIQKARSYLEEALELHRAANDQRGEAEVLNSLGIVSNSSGRPEQAISYYGKALEIHRREGDRVGEGVVLGNLGNIYRYLGEVEKAKKYHETALKIHRETQDRRLESDVLVSLAADYGRLCQHDQAIEYFESALKIQRDIPYKRGEGTCLYHLAMQYGCIGQQEKAIEYLEEALAIHRATGNRRFEGAILNCLGHARSESLRCPLHGREPDTPPALDPEKALEDYEMALEALREIGARAEEAKALWSLGSLHAAAGRRSLAHQAFREAHRLDGEIMEGVERGLEESAVESLNAGRSARLARYLPLLLKLREEARSPDGQEVLLTEALEVVEGLRTRTLLASMRAGDVRGILGSAAKEDWDRIVALRETMSRYVAKTNARLAAASETREEASGLLQSRSKRYREEIASLERKLKAGDPKLASLFDNRVALSVKDLGEVLGEDETLLHYTVVGPKVVVFTFHRARGLDVRILEVDARKLEAEVIELSQALGRREGLSEAPALKARLAGLRGKLLAGLESRVAPAGGLVIVPDSYLHLLPWEALVLEDGRYLIEEYRVRYAPSIHVLAELRRRDRSKAAKSLVVYGDPDFGKAAGDRPGIAVALRGGNEFVDLLHAGEEVQAISRLFKKTHVVLRQRRQASEARFKKEAGRGAILHVATHGRFAASAEALALPLFHSGLVFAGYNRGGVGNEDGFLTAGEVMGLELRAVDLAVLSACETGAGTVRGFEGKFGLERAFFVAGVRTFVGSLWQVDDRATSGLMVRFYRNLRKGVTKAEALRRAKLDFISGRHRLAEGGSEGYQNGAQKEGGAGDRGIKPVPKRPRDLSHPFYWASFILSGDGSSMPREP